MKQVYDKIVKSGEHADLEARQAFGVTMFPNGLHFDIKNKKFGNVELSPLYRVISNKKRVNNDNDLINFAFKIDENIDF